jgi:hypothetical protein
VARTKHLLVVIVIADVMILWIAFLLWLLVQVFFSLSAPGPASTLSKTQFLGHDHAAAHRADPLISVISSRTR